MAIVGASYTAGIGPDNPAQSWAVRLARLLHWNAVIYGVPGAGYVARRPAAGAGRSTGCCAGNSCAGSTRPW